MTKQRILHKNRDGNQGPLCRRPDHPGSPLLVSRTPTQGVIFREKAERSGEEEECVPLRHRASVTRNHRGACQHERSSSCIFSFSSHCPHGLSLAGKQTSFHTGVTHIPQSPYVQLKTSEDTSEPKRRASLCKFLPLSAALCLALISEVRLTWQAQLSGVSQRSRPEKPLLVAARVLLAGDPGLAPPG